MANICLLPLQLLNFTVTLAPGQNTYQSTILHFIPFGNLGCTMAQATLGIVFDMTATEVDATGNPVAGGFTTTITGQTANSQGDLAIPMTLPIGSFEITVLLTSLGGNTCAFYSQNAIPCEWTSSNVFTVFESSSPNGCTDPLALNYNASATVDDGSCTYPIPGCIDPTALNYNAAADTDDGSCVYPRLGCTDPLAQNYDPLATTDDGSCIYCVWGCMNPNASNYNANATCDNGSCIPCVYGCTNPSSSNYNPLATCDDGSCTGCVYGCTDSTSSNYNSSATCDDGSCCVDGCTDSTAINYNVLATCDDGTCQHCVYGCMDTNASNYNASATCDDGSCLESECGDCFKLLNVLYKEAKCEGCNEDDYLIEKRNLQRFTNLRIMRDIAYECGDTDYVETMQAEEYEMCSTLLDEHTNEGVNDYKVYGCTNPASANYNSKATHPCTRNGIVNFCCGDSSTLKTSGCTDPLASNYNPSANIDDGNCTYPIYGCTNPIASNYEPTATVDDGTCILPIVIGPGTGI